MNTNIPPQTNTTHEGVKPTPATGHQDGYGSQQTPYADEMQEKHPMHPVTQGATAQGSQFQDMKDPNAFRSERDDPGYNPDANPNALESGQYHEPPSKAEVPFRHRDQATTGYDAKPVQPGYEHAGYNSNQQQTPYANELQEKRATQPYPQEQPLQGRQFDDNTGTTGFQPEQDHVHGGAGANAVGAQQMPPSYEGHTGSMYQDQNYASGAMPAGEPGASPIKSGPAAGPGFSGNRREAAAGNRIGDQYDHQKTTTGTTGSSWRTDPTGKFRTYLSHPSVVTTANQVFSGGPFASTGPHTSLEPTTREARHLKTSGKMEEMVGKMVGSESLQRRGQEKVVLGRNMAVQVQDLKQAGKLEAKAHKLRGKGGVTGGDGGVPSGGPAGGFAPRGPAEQPGAMGPPAEGGQFNRGY
ncbi:hypothetical protein FRC01_003364 [Tulasnella sp. 417]|nr:hypothetical protein FRC01_003364 [Tulasnella sp. 417]